MNRTEYTCWYRDGLGRVLEMEAMLIRVMCGTVNENRERSGVGFVFFFQAEDGIRDRDVTGVRRVLFRSSW